MWGFESPPGHIYFKKTTFTMQICKKSIKLKKLKIMSLATYVNKGEINNEKIIINDFFAFNSNSWSLRWCKPRR